MEKKRQNKTFTVKGEPFEINILIKWKSKAGLFLSGWTLTCPWTANVDANLTNVMAGNLVKVMAWYDNEMGFSHRMLDLAVYMGSK